MTMKTNEFNLGLLCTNLVIRVWFTGPYTEINIFLLYILEKNDINNKTCRSCSEKMFFVPEDFLSTVKKTSYIK